MKQNVIAKEREDGRARIISAALDVFSTSGFEGASLRQIASQAGVMHQLVVYHFKTKETLWRVAIDSILKAEVGSFESWHLRLEGKRPSQALAELVRAFVRFSARRPEFHRITTFEGRTDNSRIRWLLETYVQPYFELSTCLLRAAQAEGAARPGDPGQLHYAVIGLVTTSFVFAFEYRTMTGLDPFSAAQIESTEALVWDFLQLVHRD